MSFDKQIPNNTVLEEALLYRSLEAQGQNTEEVNLPEPTPREQWLEKEAGGDRILYGLLLSKEQNEAHWANLRERGLPDEEYFHEMDQYDLASWGLNKAMQKREKELAKKQVP